MADNLATILEQRLADIRNKIDDLDVQKEKLLGKHEAYTDAIHLARQMEAKPR